MNENYGLLLNQDAKLQRARFEEMTKLLGIQAKYMVPNGKDTTLQGEYTQLGYTEPIKVGVIFAAHEDQKTAKKLGWNAELTENAAVIHVPYDLPDLQIGCLFEIPSAFDNTPGRLFRVTKMSAIMVYPASIACEIVPEYLNTMEKSETVDFVNSDFNLLYEG